MADRPFDTPLPADLPENWTSGQIVAPAGADVGLSQQHGYNYLMEQVNAVQRAANAINESFDTISGKRTCRVTVGTATAGWTQADCDYLCDGTNDEEMLAAAISAVRTGGGGEVAVLAGQYNLANLFVADGTGNSVDLALTGEPGATVLVLSKGINFTAAQAALSSIRLFGITFQHDNPAIGAEANVYMSRMSAAIESCIFHDVSVFWTVEAPSQEENRYQFVFQKNTMEFTYVGNIPLRVSAYSGRNSAVVSGNTFLVGWGQGSYGKSVASLNISGSFDSSEENAEKTGAVFTGNTVICDQESAGLMVRVGPAGIISNNIFVRTSIYARVRVVCAGNYVEGGRIVVIGEGQVTGNIVAAPDSLSAIDVMKGSFTYDPEVDQTPNITGNTVVAGSIGVHLGGSEGSVADTSQAKALVACNRITGCDVSVQIESNWSECLVTGNMIDSAVVDNGTGNLVRLNSDDTGSGGGGVTAGVTSFKGRSGVVVPMEGDYTAAMVGAVSSGAVQAIQAMTQAEYDALAQKNPATLYLIKE